ncbi:MAG: transporter [Geobacteraceae bacterium]|nr:transporter [Geobacteraceae bacterium]
MRLRTKTVMLGFTVSILATTIAHAGLLATDGAEPVEAKHAEVELNGSYLYDKSKNSGITTKSDSTDGDITVTAGIVKRLDIAVGLPYTSNAREKVNGELTSRSEGLNDMTVDFKYQFMEMNGLKLAIKPGVILPTGNTSKGLSDGHAGFAVALLGTGEFAEGKLLLHANAGYVSHNYKDVAVKNFSHGEVFNVSIACEAEIVEGLKLAADTGIATNTDRASNTLPVYALVGAKYEFNKHLEGYAGIRFGLSKPEADSTALFGAVLKF